MFWRWLLVFGCCSFGIAIVFLLNFSQLKLASHGEYEFFGFKFSSYWSFLAFYAFVSSPLLILANYLFFAAYHLGHQIWREVFCEKFWVINLTNSLAGVFILLVLTWLCFQEVPSKGTLVGLILSIIAILVSIFWK